MSRDTYLRRVYGISEAEYDDLLIHQNGRCAICKELPPEGKLLCVDHNHRTGSTRGLLCDACNKGVGFLQDSPERLRTAIAYLAEYDGPEKTEVPLETLGTAAEHSPKNANHT